MIPLENSWSSIQNYSWMKSHLRVKDKKPVYLTKPNEINQIEHVVISCCIVEDKRRDLQDQENMYMW